SASSTHPSLHPFPTRRSSDLSVKGQVFADKAEIVVCPTYLALDRVCGILKGTSIKVGAQDAHWENQGAFTSKISVDMLKAIGVRSEEHTSELQSRENLVCRLL